MIKQGHILHGEMPPKYFLTEVFFAILHVFVPNNKEVNSWFLDQFTISQETKINQLGVC